MGLRKIKTLGGEKEKNGKSEKGKAANRYNKGFSQYWEFSQSKNG